eukprot:Plantae.Rhodophyta-Purpureofilum_apyrenoidigerum.ctg1883.p1 GENE.Plantae.Rhodophyta-Purpureofilum_apyrenoidigerum.ctg1883~~Plantae.Rhodophyta-Purpureofilum_apyrenoidigerum.ctg1883.p1  ORF type:complete len:577 (-),score=109.57 Plantae.Rhodophyta-Purpureofilum_apyrenoidigerum.ctg1883:1392-3122(-)
MGGKAQVYSAFDFQDEDTMKPLRSRHLSSSNRPAYDVLMSSQESSLNTDISRADNTDGIDVIEFDDLYGQSRKHLELAKALENQESDNENQSDDPIMLSQDWVWKLLVEPRILPLTTEKPSHESDLRHSLQYGYEVSMQKSSNTPDEKLAMVKELVCQRMVMDYQVVVGASDDTIMHYEAKLNRSAKPKGKEMERRVRNEFNQTSTTRCLLAKGEQYHELIVRPDRQGVGVIRHVRKDNFQLAEQPYIYNLWSQAKGGLCPRSTTFKYCPEKINWNKLDQIILAGADLNILEQISCDMCRKASFVLIAKSKVPGPVHYASELPIEHTNVEYANFARLLELATRGQDLKVDLLRDFRRIPLPWRPGCVLSRKPLNYRVDMNSFRGESNEWIILEVDPFYSIECCFQINIKWIVCDGNVVVDYAQMLQRRAKQLGLTIVPVPITLFGQTQGAFENRLQHHLTSLQAMVMHEALLSRHEFVVKSSSETGVSYVHDTGSVVMNISKQTASERVSSRHMLTFVENTLPDFMESYCIGIYHEVTGFLNTLTSDEACIAELVLLSVEIATDSDANNHKQFAAL